VGGDEFMVVMPDCSLAEAEPAINIIRGGINAYRLDLGKRGMIDYVSCKIGTGVFPTDGNSPEAIMAAVRDKMA
jgi:GGDEF domain-containing protein